MVKVLVRTFDQEKAFSWIVKIDGSFAELILILNFSSIEIVAAQVAGCPELAVRGGDGGGRRGAGPGGGAGRGPRQESVPGGEGGRAAAARARVEAGDGGR